jgi:hypothetical protein
MDHRGRGESGTDIDLGSLKPFMCRDEPPNHHQEHTGVSVSEGNAARYEKYSRSTIDDTGPVHYLNVQIAPIVFRET